MKKSRDYLTYLDDILNSILSVKNFIEGMTFEDFINDEKTQFAVIRAIEIIGEAGKKIPNPVKEKSPEIEWREISGMRDMLVHEYFGIDLEVVWHTAQHDLPNLKNKISELINNLH